MVSNMKYDRSIQNRIILLIALIGAGMIVGTLISRRLDSQRIGSLLEKKKLESSILLNRVVEYNSKSLRDFAYDYTYWDDMVKFTKTEDSLWARDNIEVSLPTFDIDYAWVYRTDLSLLYSVNTEGKEELKSIPLPAKELESLVATGSLYDFYIKTQSALIQISGGSVHPTSDPERKTPPNGYFFVGRIWTEKYIDEIEEFTGTSLSIVDPVKNSIPVDSIILGEYRYINFKSLNGWNGNVHACLRSSGIMDIARDFQNRSQNIHILVMITLILTLGCVSFILVHLINRPLKSLITSLMADDPEPIRGLIRQKSEFGHIAQLMSDFFIQKKKLVEEIEERIKIESELILAMGRAEESDRLKAAFLNNISHEIRTPMNAIIGFSELIEDPGITEEEKFQFSEIIHISTYRLLGTITDLVSLSSIESGQVVIEEEKINLNSLLQKVFTQIKREIDTKPLQLNLDVELKDDYSMILSDRSKLIEILLNLLKNSVKFTQSGRIEFGYTIRDAEIEFFVRDTGIGIPLAKFDNIFARFQQADDSLTRQFGGTGLGLPISKAYVELLGGRMWLKSEVGAGTQFYFTIPYKPA